MPKTLKSPITDDVGSNMKTDMPPVHPGEILLEDFLKLIRSLSFIGDEIIYEQKLSMNTVVLNTDFNRADKTLVA